MSRAEVDIVQVVRQRVASYATGIDRNVRPTGPYVTDRQQDDAVELALAWYDAADDRRITVADLDMVGDDVVSEKTYIFEPSSYAVAAYLEPHRKELIAYIESRPMLVTGTTVAILAQLDARVPVREIALASLPGFAEPV